MRGNEDGRRQEELKVKSEKMLLKINASFQLLTLTKLLMRHYPPRNDIKISTKEI